MKLLEINDLTVCFYKQFGFFKAIDELSFSIMKGEIHALIGESGSGKTLTALSILGLIDSMPGIIGGKIIFDGTNFLEGLHKSCIVKENDNGEPILVKTDPKWQRTHQEKLKKIRGNKIAMIFQEPESSLDPYFTVGEQIAEVLNRWNKCSGKAEARRIGVDWLNRVAIKNPDQVFDYYPHQLSGGMCQRAMIAIALCSEPDLLIADEPTTALDATIQKEIIHLLRSLRDQLNLTILFISHNVSLVKSIADRVTVLYKGQLLELASLTELLQQSNDFIHPFTQSLLKPVAYRPNDRNEKQSIPGSFRATTKHQGCIFYDACLQRLLKCKTDKPPKFILSDTHQTYCWLPQEAQN